MNLKTNIDVQTLLGFFSATGLPQLFHAAIAFVHPSIYTIACGHAYVSGAADCYNDDRIESILWLVLSLVAVGYGVVTLWYRLRSNPSPPSGTVSAVIPKGSVPVIAAAPGTGSPSVAIASPATVLEVTPATQKPPPQIPDAKNGAP